MSKQIEKQQTALTKPRGFEDPIDRNDLLIPRVKKLEQMSPEVIDGDLKAGQIINSITQEILPKEFIPIFFFKQWIRFNPRDTKSDQFDASFGPGDIIYRTDDSSDERLKTDGVWNGDTPPKATAFLNFLSYFPGQEMPIVVSFCNTSYKSGKKLLSLTKFAGGDMFSKKYELSCKKTQNDKGTYHVLDVKLSGVPEDQDFKKCEAFFNSFRSKDIQVHQENEESEKVPF